MDVQNVSFGTFTYTEPSSEYCCSTGLLLVVSLQQVTGGAQEETALPESGRRETSGEIFSSDTFLYPPI